MEPMTQAIPFELNGRPGQLEVRYGPNESVERSGFDLLRHRGFDITMCLGYPTMQGTVREYQATGYYTASAFIQTIHSTRRSFGPAAASLPRQTVQIDANPTCADLGVPFFSTGYPANIYDAPCNNLGCDQHLRWEAHTLFVTMPSGINHGIISFLAGYRWGYEEWDESGERQVSILPLEILPDSVWDETLPLLRRSCPQFLFA